MIDKKNPKHREISCSFCGNELVTVPAGTPYKAWPVASVALNDGPAAATDHYRIDLANAQDAIAFYYDNIEPINAAIRQARELGEQLGARAAQSALQEIKGRKNAP